MPIPVLLMDDIESMQEIARLNRENATLAAQLADSKADMARRQARGEEDQSRSITSRVPTVTLLSRTLSSKRIRCMDDIQKGSDHENELNFIRKRHEREITNLQWV